MKVIAFFILCWLAIAAHGQPLAPKKAYASTLLELTDKLLALQKGRETGADCGALTCTHCHVLHTRAAEAVYPFAVAYRVTGRPQYLLGAKHAAEWLIRQQEKDGSWKETPEEWTGTTTDQLLMLLLAYEVLGKDLTKAEQSKWMQSMNAAAAYLDRVMSPGFASINYVATTTATLAKAAVITGEQRYSQTARKLAHRTVSKMDEKGFINGEGGRGIGVKLGIDLGYEMEMSLWGLGLYARITGDTLVDRKVRDSLKEHLYFIYPDGSLDNSWGIRSNKWTLYGGATSDGCQALFSLYANDDPRYTTASLRNLDFLKKSLTSDGLIGYGPHHGRVFSTPPCIYPTFTKAKNLALAYSLETADRREDASLPSDEAGWIRYFDNLDIVQVRTKNFMATVTGYRYKDQRGGSRSKYMFRPNGGTVSYLWAKGYGALQASSVTEYSRPEPMSFPEAPGVKCLTPQISYTDSLGHFTNLFESDARLKAVPGDDSFTVEAIGELKNRDWINGGVAYRIRHTFADDYLEKQITLTYHDAFPVVTITEPFVLNDGARVVQANDRTVQIGNNAAAFELQTDGTATLITGREARHYWTPYPALQAFPVELEVLPPAEGFTKTITYRLTIKK
ncbi:MAG: hypothetical protein ABS46_20275 [Cytophagaceae bacterium SCN 52-12]|nr:MAG: hypothetical protein ABS46_20275 [Cytophagaceae bacterium SCN 52-12]